MGTERPLAERIAGLKRGATGHDLSPARRRIRDTFRVIRAARDRGVTWQQITDELNAEIAAAGEGGPVTVGMVRALYSAERKLREKGKPEKAAAKGSPPALPEPASAATEIGTPAPAPAAPQETAASEGEGWKAKLAQHRRQQAEDAAEDKPLVQHKPGMRGRS